jgi:hypothetical protein
LIDILEKLSGNFRGYSPSYNFLFSNLLNLKLELEKYLVTRDQNMLWQPEDDEVLNNTKSVDDLQFRLILRYKGRDSVLERIQFKELTLQLQV